MTETDSTYFTTRPSQATTAHTMMNQKNLLPPLNGRNKCVCEAYVILFLFASVCEVYVIPFLFGSFFTVCHPYIDLHFVKYFLCYFKRWFSQVQAAKRQWHLAVETVEAQDRKVSFEGTTCTNGSRTLNVVKSPLLCWKTTIPMIAML